MLAAATKFALIVVAAAPPLRATAAASTTAAAHHSHVLANNLELGILLAILFPSIELQSVTANWLPVYRSSISRVRLPIRITRLKLAINHSSANNGDFSEQKSPFLRSLPDDFPEYKFPRQIFCG